MVRCPSCRGLKQIPGIGGLIKDCWNCDGVGRVAKEGVTPVVTLPVIEEEPLQVDDMADDLPVEGLAEARVAAGIEEGAPLCVDTPIVKGPKLPGYSDELIDAILAEVGMSLPEWKQKYRNVVGLISQVNGQLVEVIGLRERAAIREMYALSLPVAPRRVDVMKSQDRAVGSDPDYVKAVKATERAEKIKSGKK